MKKLFVLILCLMLLPLNVPLVWADDSDIFGANIQPNVMLFIDTSGSMDDSILADPYDSAATYTGTYTPTVVYKYQSKQYSLYKTTVNEVTGDDSAETTAIRNALNTGGTWSGKIGKTNYSLYLGSYLNWLATPGSQQVKKIVVAKQVYTSLINAVDGVRFGLSRFTGNSNQGPGGARVLAPMGSSKATLLAAVNGLTADGYTPLGGALRDIGKYYKGLGDFNGNYTTSPIEYECQPNFAILMTDGLENGTVKLAPQATLRRTEDHSGFPELQNVVVNTIGFALSAADKADGANDILQTAATNGGGTFYSTDGQAELEAALQDAIRRIIAATFTFATPVIPTTSATGINRAYLAAVQSNPSRPFWRGFVKAYQRGSNGEVPTDANAKPLDSALAWEAGAKLAATPAANRTIYTLIGGTTLQSFAKTNSNVTPARLGFTGAEATTANRDKVIDFIRGVDSTDENGNSDTTEEREWKLGDIFHSTPVVVTPPFLPSPDASYTAFRNANATRMTAVLIGANDGMLHAFKETNGVTPSEDGKEMWAFIPPNALGNLKNLTATSGEHVFFVDASPVAADVKISGAWKTIVIFGERRGGKVYHALDVTDTTNPLFLWSFTDTKMGETWSEPIIGKVKMNSTTGSTEKYVAIFGGGYDTASNNTSGKAVFVVDIATGQTLWEYFYSTGATDDRQYMRYSIPGTPLALDLNNDGFIDRIYIGDLGGQLWKFDLAAAATLTGGTTGTVNNWTGKRFLRVSSDANPPGNGEYFPTQAIYGTPNAALGTDNKLWIYFGTGDRNHPNNSTAPNRFYGVQDDQTVMTNGVVWTEANLSDVTGANPNPTMKGWYSRLGTAEKVLAGANIFNKVVYFSTFTPTSTAVCGGGGGAAKLYAVQMTTGFAAVDWAHNATVFTTSTFSNTRGKTIGTGIPSKPIVILTDTDGGGGTTVTTSVIAGTTSQQLPSNPAPPPDFMRRILYWREAF